MSNLMLTLDDAVNVAKRYSDMDEVILRNEFEQKCWITLTGSDPRKRLVGLIMDINPEEIASQIGTDNLRKWCEAIQVQMQMATMQLGRPTE